MSKLDDYLQQKENEREARRQKMRATMPEIASVVDQVRGVFGEGVRVTYASENGYEVGKKPR